jgi:4-amino-4-deoxy-L-arabinose transferase-like glycosyltransferase
LNTSKILEYVKANSLIIGIVIFAFLLRVFALYEYGLNLTLNSDDVGYTKSARVLIETGMLTYHQVGEPTVHIMPGQSVLLAMVFLLFGIEEPGLYAARVVISLFGVISIIFVYAIGKYVFNKWTGLIAAFLLATSIPQVLTDNLLLTESPFMAGFYVMLFYSLKLGNEYKMKHFYGVILAYLFCLMFRPTIALFPLVLLIYLLIKKYPFKLMIKQFFIALGLLLLVLGPWWARNYIHYEEFIPLSGGTGNPLLLGTYQGEGYRYGDPYDEVLKRINEENPDINAYENMEIQKEAALDRLKHWWDESPTSLIKSFILDKTVKQWNTQFYWVEIFGFTEPFIQKTHKAFMIVALLFLLLTPLFYKKRLYEILFLVSILVYFTILNDLFFAYDRYNQPLMGILYIFVGCIITIMIKKILNKQNKIDKTAAS